MREVTFIIPTMGRATLPRAIESLEAQNVPDWRAIVAFDNRYAVNYTPSSPKVKVMTASEGGHAGLIRNFAIDHVDTDWIAFLDDDDWVETTYVQKLRGYSTSHPHLDIIVFTYKDVINGNVVPHKSTKKIQECKVGISFAIKTEFVRQKHIKFTPFAIEDFRFLDDCVKSGAKYFITHDLQYYVGGRGGWLRKQDE